MLNTRLYRTCWIVALIALVIAPLTLRSPASLPEPDVPTQFDGTSALLGAQTLAKAAPERLPGSVGDRAAADWMRKELAQATRGSAGVAKTGVKSQRFVVRTGFETRELENVYVVERGSGNEQTRVRDRAVILVVAPRDTPPGATGGTSGDALLVELAKRATTTTHSRPIYFLSTSGSTLGNAGIRWFLKRFSDTPIAAAIVLDAPGEAPGTGLHLWMGGSDSQAAIAFREIVADSASRSARVATTGIFWSQLARYAVPQSVGEQGPIIAAGIPAVTLSARSESQLPARTVEPKQDRMALVGTVAQAAITSIDQSTGVPRPTAGILMTGKLMRPQVVRLALLMLLMPIVVMAVDVAARLRREGIFLGRGMRALRWRLVAPVVALATGPFLAMAGLVPEGAGGKAPLPGLLSVGIPQAAGIVIAAATGPLIWRLTRIQVAKAEALPPTDAASALIVLAGLLVFVWWLVPYGLILALPAAHVALVASMARERWQLVALGLCAFLPFFLVASVIGDMINRGIVYSSWYLIATTLAGNRGWLGPLLGVLVGVCVWTVAAPAFHGRRAALRRVTPRVAQESDAVSGAD